MLNAEDRQNHFFEERKKEEEEAEKDINVGNHALVHSVCDFLLILFCTRLCVCVIEYRARVPAPTRATASVKLLQNKCSSRYSFFFFILSLTGCECCANLYSKIDAISRRILFTIFYYIILFFPCLCLCSMSNGRCSSHFPSRRESKKK